MRLKVFSELRLNRLQMFQDSKRKRSRGAPAVVIRKNKPKWRRVKCFQLKFGTAADTFRLPQFLVDTMETSSASPPIKKALTGLSRLVVTSSFSGVGFAELGLQSLLASKNHDLKVKRQVEINRHCREVLLSRNHSGCVFDDIQALVPDFEMGTAAKPPRCRSSAVKAYCHQHARLCPVAPKKMLGQLHLEVAGPPCPPWSRFGCRRGESDIRHRAHDAWVSLCRQEEPDLILFENVVGYKLELLDKNFADKYRVLPEILDPRLFGAPMSRPRVYSLLVHKSLDWKGTEASWLLDAVKAAGGEVHSSDSSSTYDNRIYAELPDDGSRRHMTSKEHARLEAYNGLKRLGEATVVDLTQSAKKPVASLVDGALPVLRTSCRGLYMRHAQQFLSCFQLLRAMGYPVHPSDAAQMSLGHCPLPSLPKEKLFTMIGNGMFPACVALAVLTAMLHIDL
ncbi:unnamed protein product [Symbiodinium sp. CCMP2592]|nr:unnamed protein product [Symbiodinium sp. CCMP2592]